MATKKTTEEKTTFDLTPPCKELQEKFIASLSFLDSLEAEESKASEKSLSIITSWFNLPSKDGKVQVPNFKDPSEGQNLLSRKWFATFFNPEYVQQPGQSSPLHPRVLRLIGCVNALKTSKTDKAAFIGGKPTRAKLTCFLLSRYKKLAEDQRERELKRLLKPVLLLPGLSPDVAFHLKCLVDGTPAVTTTETIPAFGTGTPVPKGKTTIKKKEEEEVPASGSVNPDFEEFQKFMAFKKAMA